MICMARLRTSKFPEAVDTWLLVSNALHGYRDLDFLAILEKCVSNACMHRTVSYTECVTMFCVALINVVDGSIYLAVAATPPSHSVDLCRKPLPALLL